MRFHQVDFPPGDAAYKKKLKSAIDSAIGVGVSIKLLEPKSLARSMGKATRCIDNRKIKNKFTK